MNSLERFYATLNREPVDRPACWLGMPDEDAKEALFSHFDVSSVNELREKVHDDFYTIELPYKSPDSNAIYAAFNFAKESAISIHDRTLTSPGFFEDYTDPAKIDDFNWPDPSLYIDTAECLRLVEEAPKDKPVLGVIWSAHFQDACAAFGMETALVKMLLEPDMFRVVIEKILDFYLKANEIFYEATKGKLHAVLIGNDLGSQTGLMLSPGLLREFVFPGTKKLVDQAHRYGLKVIHHSCGSIIDIIPDLIEQGVDAIHPIQALATGMDPYDLKEAFGQKVAFCGGVDAQQLLVNGTPKQVAAKVKELKTIFPTGLIISPSHEAILMDIPPANIEALFNSIAD